MNYNGRCQYCGGDLRDTSGRCCYSECPSNKPAVVSSGTIVPQVKYINCGSCGGLLPEGTTLCDKCLMPQGMDRTERMEDRIKRALEALKTNPNGNESDRWGSREWNCFYAGKIVDAIHILEGN